MWWNGSSGIPILGQGGVKTFGRSCVGLHFNIKNPVASWVWSVQVFHPRRWFQVVIGRVLDIVGGRIAMVPDIFV